MKPHVIIQTLFFFIPIFLLSCKTDKKYFTARSPDDSGIDFENSIEESPSLNIMNYEYMYNGGGVAIGDVNGDGLPDIYFTANTKPNKLYLNLGHLQFRDITEAAGVAGKSGWKTGVTMCDVNADGLPDIYVCYSGNGPASTRGNQLFINKGVKDGVPVFDEMAAAYGLDGNGSNSTQAAFLDYDHDGDLDMVLINHATMFYDPFYNTQKLRTKRHPYFSSKFFRNDSHGDTIHFTDVSEQVGIKGGGNNFNLGIAIGDINNDGWPDMYITNDYEEQDYLYINQHDGTFKDATRTSLAHTSRYGMGVDLADYNNDGLTDIMVLDMFPEDNHRRKLLQGPDDFDKYHLLIDNGYHHQNMRNTLQLNIGIKPDGDPVFSEIGQLAGVSNTDWSWAPLFADFDNDGYKDLFITNGFLHDFNNLDFIKFTVAEARAKYGSNMPLYDLVKQLHSTKISNYLFLNNRDLTFRDITGEWGLNTPSVSNGAAYADLDNDGDLDLVINNLNEPAVIWENHANEINPQHYLTVVLKGNRPNPFAIGAKVTLQTGMEKQYQEMYPTRGYQSSVDHRLHFGLGKNILVDQLIVQWPSGRSSVLRNIKSDQLITVGENKTDADSSVSIFTNTTASLFEDCTTTSGINFIQQEDPYVDFKYQRLLPYQLSMQGPKLCKGDVNNDGLEDIYICGPYGQPGILLLQKKDGSFIKTATQPWSLDGKHEDAGAVFFDADADGDPDLYIVSSRNEDVITNEEQQDRLYLNDGKGNFSKVSNALPAMTGSRSCVAAIDFDKDGDLDLFVGGFAQPGNFPLASNSHLLRNDSKNGKILFTDITNEAAQSLQQPGMITDAVWVDINKDGWPDLLIVGQWMPVKLFLNDKGKLKDASAAYGLDSTGGLWTKIFPVDIDDDGDMDFVLGNLAPNTQFKASKNEPMCIYASDFDGSGTIDPLLCYYIQGKSYPYASKDELTNQVVSLKKKYVRYDSYADETPQSIFGEEALKKSKVLNVQELKNVILLNEENKKFTIKELPVAAQFSALQSIISDDLDNDGKKDLLLCGNFYPFRTQLGREDAGKGLILKGDGKGNFIPLFYHSTGVLLEGDIRDMTEISTGRKEKLFIIAKNSDTLRVIRKK